MKTTTAKHIKTEVPADTEAGLGFLMIVLFVLAVVATLSL